MVVPGAQLGHICHAQRAQAADALVALVLHADRQLRHRAILLVDGVAGHAHFHADDVLLDVQVVQRRGAAFELLLRQRQFDAVGDADGHAIAAQRIILRLEVGVMGVGAPAVARAVAGDQRPRRDAAAARTVDFGHAAGGQELAHVGRTIDGQRIAGGARVAGSPSHAPVRRRTVLLLFCIDGSTYLVTMARCIGASFAISLFDTLDGTLLRSMAICKSSASALNWALVIFKSWWTVAMSRTVPTPSMVLSRYFPVYLQGPPLNSQNCSPRRTASCCMSKSAKLCLMPSLPPRPW